MRPEKSSLRVLVAVANHGVKNRALLDVLLAEYRSMDFDVDLVVLSDRPKDLGDDVEVLVGAPTTDPWSLPFAHRRLFAERADDYDLFVYSEDDTHITQRNLEAFLAVDALLGDDEVPGFLRYEVDSAGARSYSSIHSTYRWLPDSVVRRGTEVFASFSNAHSGCAVLSRRQLRRAIASGGYLVAPHNGEYDMLVSAGVDPYTQCGLTRRICVSRVDDFLLHHLSNAYLGRMGVSEVEFRAQLGALLDIAAGTRTRASLFDPASRLPTPAWDVPTHSANVAPLLPLASRSADRVLSVGCTSGALERSLFGEACAVTAIPLDEVLSAVARTRGIATTAPTLGDAFEELAGRRFPVILVNDVLHHVEDPAGLLRTLGAMLEPAGRLLVTVPNFRFHRTKQRMRRPVPPVPRRGYAADGIHPSDTAHVERWFVEAGLERPRLLCHNDGRGALLSRLAPRRFGRTVVAASRAPGDRVSRDIRLGRRRIIPGSFRGGLSSESRNLPTPVRKP